MAQVFPSKEKTKKLELLSATSLRFPSGSVITVGGQQYSLGSDLDLDIITDIDTGVLAADTLYYVYLNLDSTPSLIYSLSDLAPAGVTGFRLIGNFISSSISEIESFENHLDEKDNSRVGEIVALGHDNVPEGYIKCDGRQLSRSVFASLFGRVGSAHGDGDTTTTFHLPDLRGRMIRGTDTSAGNDPNAGTRTAANTGGNTGDNVGSYQDDQFKSHTHNYTYTRMQSTFSGDYSGSSRDENNVAGVTAATGGSETRPKNVNVIYAIKY